MPRAALPLLLVAAAAALLLLAAPADARPPLNEFGCPPGCTQCRQLTEQEVAALKAKKEAKLAEKQQWRAARNGGAGAGGPSADKQRSWLQRLSEGPLHACEACIEGGAYELKEGRCTCAAGYGWPKYDRSQGRPAAGGAAKAAPTCTPCPEGTVSGPDAPKPDWAALKAKRQAAKQAAAQPAGNRHLLGADGGRGGGFKHGGFCVPCPEGTKANAARTKCA